MAGWQVPVPGLPLVAAPPAMAAGTPSAPARTVETGGTPENRWQYTINTQIYTRWWAITYAGLWFDGQRTRPVQWTLDDMERTVIDGVDVWKETWSWAYLQ